MAQALGLPEPMVVRVLAACVEDGLLAYRAGYYAMPDFTPQLTPEQRSFFERALAPTMGDGAPPLPFADLVATMKSAKVPGVTEALDTLLAGGTLVRVGEFLYRGAQIAELRAVLERALRNGGGLTVSEFRSLTGTTRKYAVPLLEYFDAAGVTLRNGDLRVLRRTASPHSAG
jgi:selenocysteine-specific elongation factor